MMYAPRRQPAVDQAPHPASGSAAILDAARQRPIYGVPINSHALAIVIDEGRVELVRELFQACATGTRSDHHERSTQFRVLE
jgi:hypothetical protein